jgi:hypothetical protein
VDDRDHPFAAVRCQGDSVEGQKACGLVELTLAQYERQMMAPNSLWCCPNCGSTATYDDARSEQLQGIADDDDDSEVPR